MSRYDHIRRPPRLDPIKRRPLLLSPIDQNIASPVCVFDDQSTQSVTIHSSDIEETSNESYNTDDEQSSASWITSTSRKTPDLAPTPLSCAQCNTNYAPNGMAMSSDPSEIDRCTELEAMRQGLARIQAGHGRPSDFLPERQSANVDPFVRRTLDEIRQSIHQISNDAALQNEVQELRQSVNALSQYQASTGRPSNASESQLAGLLQDIRQSLRPVPSGEVVQDSSVMQALEEIRQSVHALQAAVEGDEAEPGAGVNQDTEESTTNPVLEVLNDIRQSLHVLEGGTGGTEQEESNDLGNAAVLEALNEIRDGVNVLVNNADTAAETEKDENHEAILGALSDIRQSVRYLADHGQTFTAVDDSTKEEPEESENCEGEVVKATCSMAKSMEDLQKTIEMISAKLVDKCDEACKSKKSKSKCEKRKKSKCKKPEPEICEDELSECIKECCKEPCKLSATCDKLIRFLIAQNCGGPRGGGAPAVHYLVPPTTTPVPRFIAPFPRHPRPLPPPPPSQTAMLNCPQIPTQQAPPPRFCPPPPQPSMYSAPPCYPPPQQFPSMASMPPPSPPQPPAPPCPPPSVFNQASTYSQPPCYPQPSINIPEIRGSTRDSALLPPRGQSIQSTSVASKPPLLSERDQPVVFNGSINDQPMAFTLTFDGTGNSTTGTTNAPNFANRKFICTQVEQ